MFEDTISNTSIDIFKSFLGVIPTPISAQHHAEFTEKVNYYLQKEPFNFTLGAAHDFNVKEPAFHLYDAVMMYARALNECLSNPTGCRNPKRGTALVNYILDRPFQSYMGFGSYIGRNGTAQGNYSLLALKEHVVNASHSEFGLYDVAFFRLNDRNRSDLPILAYKNNETFSFPFGRAPLDEPACGFDMQKCQSKGEKYSHWYLILGIAGIFVLVVFALIAGMILYRYQLAKREAAMWIWKIEWEQLNVEKMQKYMEHGLDQDGCECAISTSVTSVTRLLDAVFVDVRVPKKLNTELGFYNNRVVAVKLLKKPQVTLTSEAIKELIQAHSLRNDNLCNFIGASLEPVCVVTEFCPRGSLHDVLYDEKTVLDCLFMESMVGDIVRGMCYLHMSPIKSHGNLKPTKCLVDSRFTVKISDYGLHEFRRGASYDPLFELCEFRQYFDRLVWTAPELLRDPHRPPAGTPAGDVYSFSLILYEIYAREGPFERIRLTSQDLINALRTGRPGAPLRPRPADLIEISDVPDYVVSVMTDCWSEDPAQRPDFQTIKKRLQVKPTIMDNVLALLQRYSNNLEGLVAERTTELEKEKTKTETLLFEILPRPVAEQLIKQGKVEAEQYESVTIFFSDLVGFTAMSAESTPMEVVAFLNDLYTLFDSLLEHYDAYKVETIGDSYMVCSGLPIRNGDAHAGVVASMSLHLLEEIQHFRIQHRPDQPLLLRIGIHSGPVVTGVIGRKMPRYCLFGDTVNTTSRYESTGLPQKIHCSPQCKVLLDSLGGYQLEPRGVVHMKGKGDLLTYWLVDEDQIRKDARRTKSISLSNDPNIPSPILQRWGNRFKRQFSRLKKDPSTTSSLRNSIVQDDLKK
ncbi:receptor-type guanylate cyclase Gyc76C-like isoform X2 [Paramacrobiotus metropolitanus]|uniref:receptor-type guanylate cyclase Gyc76C-like isoform X2 n=1 Tax=Paramacrobiotus metropolitanus TaxID=2943436 RepID=UPI002445B594|nr:receptor-type guanylate cyclase Gyc76C-like isoform X2 [Paramacrobiotus metropolitanus]